MSTVVTVPLYRFGCSGSRYQEVPAGLSSHLTQEEYAASMARIRAANQSPLGTRMLMLLAWLVYTASLMQICGLTSIGGVMYGQYYMSGTWLGWTAGFFSFVALVMLSHFSRKRRSQQVALAVAVEHAAYSLRQPQLAWRLVNLRFVEIRVVDALSQQHIAALEHQVHILQAQVAAQAQHQQVDHELIAHQQAAAAASHAYSVSPHYAPSSSTVHAAPQSPFHVQYYPSVAPSPAVHVPVAEPVYAQAVYQPAPGSVFAHPPPQYFTRQDMRAPLVQHQY